MTTATAFQCLTGGGVRWEIDPALAPVLLGPRGLRLPDWLAHGQARIIKQGPHRTVYRIDIPEGRFFLKHYRLHDIRAWLREVVRPSKARMECERALEVAERGVATVTPLALGEVQSRLGPTDSFLLTRALDNTSTLSLFLEQELPTFTPLRQTRLRQRLARTLGTLLARLHQSGIVHNDLHAGNLLLRLDADDNPELFLIDLHAVSLRRSLSWGARRANLIMLNRWFILRSNRADRMRAWQAYAAAWNTPNCRELGWELERATWLSNLTFWRHRDRRCRQNNRYYYRCASGTGRGYAVRDLNRTTFQELLADPDQPFDQKGVRLLKNSRSSTVAEIDLEVAGEVRAVIYKRFRITQGHEPWVALLRRSAALRSWVNGQGFLERCLPTPRPLAVFHRYRHGLPHEGYLLTEKVSDALDLRAWVASLESLPVPERRQQLVQRIEQVARLIRELHRRQLSHRDLKAANLLVQGALVWFIDLVGVTCHRHLPRCRRVQNLARLNASFLDTPLITRTDRLRFLRIYLQWGFFGQSTWKRWWKVIATATQEKIDRNRRSGRPLA